MKIAVFALSAALAAGSAVAQTPASKPGDEPRASGPAKSGPVSVAAELKKRTDPRGAIRIVTVEPVAVSSLEKPLVPAAPSKL